MTVLEQLKEQLTQAEQRQGKSPWVQALRKQIEAAEFPPADLRQKFVTGPVPVIDRDRFVRPAWSIDREDTDVRVPGAHAARLGVARIDQEALQPGVEAVRIAEAGQFTPGDHQRLLHGILGPSDIPEDPLRDRHQPVAVRSGQDGERLPVTTLRLLDEIAIQQIVLHGAHRGRLPTLLSGPLPPAFSLRANRFVRM